MRNVSYTLINLVCLAILDFTYSHFELHPAFPERWAGLQNNLGEA